MTLHGIALPDFEQFPLIIRALSSITPEQADLVADRLAELAGSWLVERHDDYDGYMSIVISAGDIDGPTVIMSGRVDAIDLSEMRDDHLHTHGRFSDMDAAIGALVGLLATS